MTTETSEFDKAFQDASDEKAAPVAAPAAPEASEPAPTSAPAPVEAPAQTEGSANSPAPAPAPVAAPAPDALEHRFKSLQGIAAKQGEELRQYRDRVAELERAKAPVAAPAPAAPDADDEILAEFHEQAPTVSNAVKAALKKQRADFDAAMDKRMAEVNERFQGQLNPLQRFSQDAEVSAHEQQISTAHPGWENTVISPELTSWVRSKPSYVQREFARISEQGTAAEIIEVLGEFKRENATSQTNPQAQQMQSQRLRAATAVETRPRPTSTAGVAEKTFDQAFEEASNKT